MVKPLISVIIPTYNTLNYIEKAINSVLNQTYDNIELIIVNDGSTDGTKEFLDDISLKYPRVNVIHQKNTGVSMARNKGLDLTRGAFVCFLDSDDWLCEDALEFLYEQIKNSNNIISACNRRNVKIKNNELIFEKSATINQPQYIPKNKALLEIGTGVFHLQSACHKLFPVSLINIDNKIRFNKEISHGEDGLFVYDVLNRATGIIFSNEPKWYVLSRPDSATKSEFTPKRLTSLKAIDNMICNANSSKLKDQLKIYYTKRTMTLIMLFSITKNKQDVIKKYLYASLRKYREVFLHNNNSLRLKIKYLLCLYTPITVISFIYKIHITMNNFNENYIYK